MSSAKQTVKTSDYCAVRKGPHFYTRVDSVMVCACGREDPYQKHDCEENAVPYKSDGALGHGFECGVCGKFLQAG